MISDHTKIIEEIKAADDRLHAQFVDKLQVNYDLDRTLVSFQANKTKNGHRWYKYKEGFSSDLVRYIMHRFALNSGCILDPFAGSGAALFTASELGVDSVGIELLPSSAEIIEVRQILRTVDARQMAEKIRRFRENLVWQIPGNSRAFPHIRITTGAFPLQTEDELGRYLYEVERMSDDSLKHVLFFAALCILEDVSYTRKDGQYLRWDHRSGRRIGRKPFHKGTIKSFTHAVCAKLDQIAGDICGDQLRFADLFAEQRAGEVQLLRGSCLDILPTLDNESFDGIITSPPY